MKFRSTYENNELWNLKMKYFCFLRNFAESLFYANEIVLFKAMKVIFKLLLMSYGSSIGIINDKLDETNNIHTQYWPNFF